MILDPAVAENEDLVKIMRDKMIGRLA